MMAMRKWWGLCAAVGVAAQGAYAQNLLKNSSFEEPGSNEETALHWKMHDPDDHGDAWGNAVRVDWRRHHGRFIGAIRGTWAGRGDYGGFWQEAEGSGGKIYRATAWFWADHHWRADTQEMKLEFWNADRTEMLGSDTITLYDIGEVWVQREVSGQAPEGTAWVRVVIHVSGTGDTGALQIDEVELEASP